MPPESPTNEAESPTNASPLRGFPIRQSNVRETTSLHFETRPLCSTHFYVSCRKQYISLPLGYGPDTYLNFPAPAALRTTTTTMFSNPRLFGYPSAPEHINYAALAEAKAAEAQYYALEAARREQEALLRAQSAFWAPSDAPCASACFNNHYAAASCHCCSSDTRAMYPYPGRGLAQRPAYFAGPHFLGHQVRQPQRTPTLPPQPSAAERELEAELRRERLARLQLEQELRRKEQLLEARQRELVRLVSNYQIKPSRSFPSPSQTQAPLFGYAPAATRAMASPDSHCYSAPRARPCVKKTPAARQSAVPSNGSTQDAIANILLQSIMNSDASAPMTHARTTKQSTHAPSSPAAKKLEQAPKKLQASLIDQLKARYENEKEGEVLETIEALADSLRPRASRNDPSDLLYYLLNGQSANAPSGGKPFSQKSAARASAMAASKGKEKEHPLDAGASISSNLSDSLKRVESIEATFQTLEAEFVFPTKLDFTESSSTSTTFPHLAFTANNHSVRYHEQSLSSLLQQLDLIESHGDSSLRLKRKLAVQSIEKALEDLEKEVAGRWKASVEKEANQSTDATPVASTSLPIDGHVEGSEYVDLSTTIIETPIDEVVVDGQGELLDQEETISVLDEEDVLPALASPTSSDDAHDTPSDATILPESTETDIESSDIASSAATLSTFRSATPTPLDEEETSAESESTDYELDVVPEAQSVAEVASGSEPVIHRESVPSSETPESPSHLQPSLEPNTSFEGTSPSSPTLSSPAHKRKSVEIEDLGSDWSDIDD